MIPLLEERSRQKIFCSIFFIIQVYTKRLLMIRMSKILKTWMRTYQFFSLDDRENREHQLKNIFLLYEFQPNSFDG